eukprot:TRINITY_DN42710_c0_g1_i2.p1 TRINITY_DN42710_c0_g1~~TRINITY_DN42710_c0_g1_i2.p1  ORF type:complete len:347 (+),score=47.87 TRINITY_DN42710_c0_g1_i2:88-1128(+)
MSGWRGIVGILFCKQLTSAQAAGERLRDDPMELLPPEGAVAAERVIVEVGANVLASYFERLEDDPGLVLIGVEPNPWAYQQHPTHERFYLLPVAIGDISLAGHETSVLLPFHRAKESGCSSLLNPRHGERASASIAEVFGPDCQTPVDSIDVPVLPLDRVLRRAASYGPIQLVEVDAEGADVSVVESAGAAAMFVPRIVLEVMDAPNSSSQHLLVDDQPVKHDIVERMRGLGFELERCWLNNWGGDVLQENCAFARGQALLDVSADCFSPAVTDVFNSLLREQIGENYMDMNGATLGKTCCAQQGQGGAQLGFWNPEVGLTWERCCIEAFWQRSGVVPSGYDLSLR